VSDRRSLLSGIAVIAIGVAAVLGGTIIGSAGADDGIASWPPLLRAFLTGLSVAIGLALLARSVAMLAEARPEGSRTAEARDVRGMIRAVRLAFLAVAALAAAGAFLVGSPLLLIVAVVIAGVDVIETTFLLLAARANRGDDGR
jgi:hypothetical protein